jgi:hypothetical protein
MKDHLTSILYMVLMALVFELLPLVTEQRLRGHKPKLVNALRSRCSVTREIFYCRSKSGASTKIDFCSTQYLEIHVY